jgi:hypothetical protein
MRRLHPASAQVRVSRQAEWVVSTVVAEEGASKSRNRRTFSSRPNPKVIPSEVEESRRTTVRSPRDSNRLE